jgi:hypothetical protein
MSNSQKTPFQRSINAVAEKRVGDAIQQRGKGLPCSVVSVAGAIVTVKFEVQSGFTLPQVTIPLFGPEYIRYPIQVGDKGVVVPLDARLGGISGLGGTVADLTVPSNLGALVFLPIGNALWSSVDQNSVTIYGPNGVVMRDTGSNSVITLTPTSISMVSPTQIKATCGGCTFTLNSSGAYTLSGSASGAISAPSLSLTDGSHNTGPTVMATAWQALVNWANSHQHTAQGATAVTTTPNTPFTGGSIAPSN